MNALSIAELLGGEDGPHAEPTVWTGKGGEETHREACCRCGELVSVLDMRRTEEGLCCLLCHRAR